MNKIPGIKNCSERSPFALAFIIALCLSLIFVLAPAPSSAEADKEREADTKTTTVEEKTGKEAVQENTKKRKEKKVTVNFVDVEIPVVVKFISEIPRTGTGKILKREMRKPYWEGRASRV